MKILARTELALQRVPWQFQPASTQFGFNQSTGLDTDLKFSTRGVVIPKLVIIKFVGEKKTAFRCVGCVWAIR